MTLDKAIEILQVIRHTGHYQPTLDDVHALELGIEASKCFKELREVIRVPYTALLPGEEPE
ncbi:hypothetical protein ES705_37489 [subsurface metagenome]